ncbi:C2 domain in Dock180 and Zizimin proteins-domain-containing protein, partial [Delphinella strobiligena]
MSWRPVKSITHAVCTHRFEATDPDDLALEIGDDVYITEIGGPTQDWCRGWLLSQPSILNGLNLEPGKPLKPRAYKGIFPRTHVEVREVLGNDQETSPEKYESSQAAHEDDGVNGSPHIKTVTRSRSIRNTRLVYRKRSDAQLEAVDVLPRRQDAPREKAPLPALRIGDATNFSREEPLVDEISSCLREWYSTKLHDLLLGHEYDLLDKVCGLVNRLDDARKQLIHDLLTEKELSELRESIVWELVDGNKMMDGGVIVRSPQEKGRILTAEDDIPEMMKLQAIMSLRSRPPPAPLQVSTLSHALVELKHFPDMQGETGVLHMYLCRQGDDGKPHPVSEVFAVEVPLDSHSSDTQPPAQLPRTLFTDLTKSEVGSATNPNSRLYLVCLLHRDEPHRAEPVRMIATPSPSIRPERLEVSSSSDSVNGGRRSFLFGSQRLRRASLDRLRPMTGESVRSEVASKRAQTPVPGDDSSRPSTTEKRVRRIVGYSAIEIGALVRQQDHSEVSLALWTPVHLLDEMTGENKPGEEGWEDVLRHLVRSPTGHFGKTKSVTSFKLYLHAFAHPDAQTLVRDFPALLQNTHCTQPLSFVSSPQLVRNDIYLTLKEAILPPGARCFHPEQGSVSIAVTGLRNLQLTLEVRTESGRRIENAIYPTSNRSAHTAFRTPAIERGEAWNQTLRLTIPIDELPEAHVVLSIADGSNFPFALAWLPLWDSATDTCRQGIQTLSLWDYSDQTATTSRGRGAYQSLPSHLNQLQAQDQSVMAGLVTNITVTSSIDAQDPNISALLNWDGNTVESLIEMLDSFKMAPDLEIIKFFRPILNVLDRVFGNFYGLSDDTGIMLGEIFAERALSCLVHVLHLTHDRRFRSTKDILEEYITDRTEPSENSTKAACRAFRAFLGRPYEIQEARELRSALKVSGQIIQFITNNHKGVPHPSSPTLNNPMISVQNAALNLLRNPREAVYGTQVIMMQNFASWLPQLAPMSTPDEILEFAEDILTASAAKKGSLRITRLVMLKELSSLEMFKTDDMRQKVLAKTSEWLQPYWLTAEDVSDHQLDGLRMCCSIIQSQQHDMTLQSLHYTIKLFEAYHILEAQLRSKEDSRTLQQLQGRKKFVLPFPKTYPFHTIPVEASQVPQEALVEIATLLSSFFQNGPPTGDVREHGMGPGREDVLELYVTRALHVLQSIQRGKAFPPQWLSLYITHAKCAVTILQWLLDILFSSFLPADDSAGYADIMSFNNDLWELWFRTLIDLSLNKTVSMENFSEQTSRAIWKIGGDVRQSAALLLRYGWESLGWKATPEYEKAIAPMARMGGFQVGLTAKLIPLAVRLCMVLHAGLRSVGLDMLRSMIISEWQLNDNLDLVQSAFFDAFDLIAQQDGPLGKIFTSAFLHDLRLYFKTLETTTEAGLYSAVVQMIKEVEKLLGVLSELRTVRDPGSHLIQLSHLTNFLRLSGKDEACVRRIHELSQTHAATRNYSSAAYALWMHLQVLDQDKSDERGLRFLPRLDLPDLEFPEESAHSRKERLLRLMMTYYEKGHSWENVVDVLNQLADGRKAVWDIAGLAEISDEKSRVYRLLAKGPKATPRYFHVSFSTHGAFPPFVRGKEFIFEGPSDCDRRSFCQALNDQFPSATNLSPEYTSPSLDDGEPTVNVSPVTTYKDHLHPINQQSGVAPQYREHCLTSNPRTFAITSRQDVPQVSVTEQVVEKTIYTTREAFPTLLSYSRILTEKKVTLNALQAAIDRTQRKTQILSVATERVM